MQQLTRAFLLALAIMGALITPAGSLGAQESPAPVLGPGDRGESVSAWEQRLNEWIRVDAPRRGEIQVDGVYDTQTERATIDLQQQLGVTVDGLVGPETRSALDAFLDSEAPTDDDESQQPTGDPEPAEVPEVEPGAGPLLERGVVGPAVTDWQQLLNTWRSDAGLDQILVDGIFGIVTGSATRQFQAASDVLVDGIVGADTRAAMQEAIQQDLPPEQPAQEPPEAGPSGPLLGLRSTGPAVSEWQEKLNLWRDDLGIPNIAVDGIYGSVTEDATRQFQAVRADLRVDGLVGPNTRAAMAATLEEQG